MSFNSVDDIQKWILKELFQEGEYITTRGLKTLELCNLNFCLENPLYRITFNEARKWKHPLAIGEFAWHVSGSNDLDFITYYARQWKFFSEDGKVIDQSCYGHKIFKQDSYGVSQWSRLIKLLKQDKFTRRAVLDLYDSDRGIDLFAKDVACVSTVQFLIRNEKLDAIVTMRSNDLIWGLPYDIYLFTMLQELLALELNVPLGRYYHNAGSMHLYERHFELGQEMLQSDPVITIHQAKMESLSGLNTFIEYEQKIRNSSLSLTEIDSLPITTYWKNLLVQLFSYRQTKSKSSSIAETM